MVEPLATADELKERLRFLGPNQDQFNLTDRLEDATLEMEHLVGRTVEEQLRPEQENQSGFRFAFTRVEEVVEVILQSFPEEFEDTVDKSNFTVTKDPGRTEDNIVFNQDFAEDNLHDTDYRLRVVYVPSIFKRLELRLAELDVTRLASIQTGDDQVAAQADKAQERVGEIQANINRTTAQLGDRDAGDSLAANFNFPGDHR